MVCIFNFNSKTFFFALLMCIKIKKNTEPESKMLYNTSSNQLNIFVDFYFSKNKLHRIYMESEKLFCFRLNRFVSLLIHLLNTWGDYSSVQLFFLFSFLGKSVIN